VAKLDLVKALDLPMATIVVLGDESAGKSTLLERLCGFALLPRAKGLCTRVAVRVLLRREPERRAEISLWSRGGGAGQPRTVLRAAEPIALESVSEAVKALMDEAAPGRRVAKDREIVVEVHLPDVPNLNLIDLPGIVTATATAAVAGGNAEDEADPAAAAAQLAEDTKALAASVIDEVRDVSLFLLVQDARKKPHLSDAARVVQQARLESRTSGVYTYLDVVSTSSNNESRGAYVAGLLDDFDGTFCEQWLGVVSRPTATTVAPADSSLASQEVARLRALSEREDKELDDLIATGGLGPQHVKRLGIEPVTDIVERRFEKFLVDEWIPKLEEKLRLHAAGLQEQSCGLGLPLPTNAATVALSRSALAAAVRADVSHMEQATLTPVPVGALARLLAARMAAVARRGGDASYLALGQDGDVWAAVAAVQDRPAAFDAEFAEPVELREAAAVQRAEAAQLREWLDDLKHALSAAAAAVPGRLTDATFATPAEPATKETVAAFLRLWVPQGTQADIAAALLPLADEQQTALLQLVRFPGLRAAVAKRLSQDLTARVRGPFRAAADAIIASAAHCVQLTTIAPSRPAAMPRYRLRYDAAVAALAGRMQAAWALDVVEAAVEATGAALSEPQQAVVADADAAESCAAQRELLLRDVQHTAEVILSMMQLREKTRDARASEEAGFVDAAAEE
jgi:hypothetical protein